MQRLVHIPPVQTVAELRVYLLQALEEIETLLKASTIANYQVRNPAETTISFDEETNKLKVYNTTTKTWVTINP